MTASTKSPCSASGHADYDVVVVGAGIGGVYAVHRFREAGLSVLGIEGASDVGGVWYHNRYPGARVDVDSIDYCYYFSQEIWKKWRWSERYAAQPELLGYLRFVADTLDIRRHFRFNTWVRGAQWCGAGSHYHVTTSDGDTLSGQFMVMASGQLSVARKPDFPGLDRFRGEWVQTSHWPDRDVAIDGLRVGLIGTGSSGVQAATTLAQRAGRLHVFQRTPNYSIPARNAPLDPNVLAAIGERLDEEREYLLTTKGGSRLPTATRPMSDYTEDERLAALERQWEFGGQGMGRVFLDQGTNKEANGVVSEFVRNKIRQTVRDPEIAEKLCPTYPIGTRRLILDTGYYEIFNTDNVSLVDVREDPLVEFTETGLRTQNAHYELDLVVFALGFNAFTGALEAANVRNENGQTPSAGWARGPRSYLGLMTSGFPNLFLPTGVGSPSVLANLFIQNEFLMDWIAGCITYLRERGFSTIEAAEEAEATWTAHVADCAKNLLRLKVDNYMVHVNKEDGTRVFIPYTGGFDRYVEEMRRAAEHDYDGFRLG